MGLIEFGSALGQIGGQNNFARLGQASAGQQGHGMRLSDCFMDGPSKGLVIKANHPKSFIEELQEETNEWLGEEWT